MARRKKSESNGDDTEHGPGHNGAPPELTAEERQALHFRHTREYESALQVKKDAASAFLAVTRRIKAEGGKVSQIKISIALKTPEGEEAFLAEMSERAEVAQWNGVGVQMALFGGDGEEDRTPLIERSRAEGKRAGMRGDPRRAPYQGEAEQEWLAGHAEGQEILVSTNMKRGASADEIQLDDAA
jgi:hypothetical protein